MFILGGYMLVEGVRGQLEVRRVTNRENPEDMIGVSGSLRRISFIMQCSKDKFYYAMQ